MCNQGHKIIPNCMIFANDVALIEKSKETVNLKLELWKQKVFT